MEPFIYFKAQQAQAGHQLLDVWLYPKPGWSSPLAIVEHKEGFPFRTHL